MFGCSGSKAIAVVNLSLFCKFFVPSTSSISIAIYPSLIPSKTLSGGISSFLPLSNINHFDLCSVLQTIGILYFSLCFSKYSSTKELASLSTRLLSSPYAPVYTVGPGFSFSNF